MDWAIWGKFIRLFFWDMEYQELQVLLPVDYCATFLAAISILLWLHLGFAWLFSWQCSFLDADEIKGSCICLLHNSEFNAWSENMKFCYCWESSLPKSHYFCWHSNSKWMVSVNCYRLLSRIVWFRNDGLYVMFRISNLPESICLWFVS